MAGKSVYASRAVLNHWVRGPSIVKPATVWIALYTADPTDADLTANELPIGVGGYARASVATGDANWAAPATSGTDEVTSNANAITFGTASAALGTVTHFGLKDAATGGNLLYSGPLGVARTIASGDPITAAAGALVLREN